MASQALYLRWRPMNFEEVVGQEHVIYTLKNALTSGRVAHAYLFAGLRGTGKTSMARLLAKAVNCTEVSEGEICPGSGCGLCHAVNDGSFLDIIEIDAASHTSVDDVRELRERVAFAPNQGRYKVYIIDEVHRFSGAAFDALLKTIEEPPAHAIFILATTEIHKVPKTILSRCQRFDFKRIPVQQIVERLRLICDAEGVPVEQEAVELVARQATGSMRDSISLLDQLIAEPGQEITLGLAQAILGTVSNDAVYGLLEAIIADDTAYGLELINHVLDEGADAQQFAREMVEYVRMVMLIQTGGEHIVETTAAPAIVDAAHQQAEQIKRGPLLRVLRAFSEAANETKSGWQPQLPLEMALIESVEAMHAAPVQAAAPAPAPQRPAQAPRQQAQAPQQPPQEAAPEPPEPQAPPPAENAPSFEAVIKQWPVFLREMEKADRMVVALLRSVNPIAIQGRSVILGVPGEFHQTKIESDQTRAIIESVLNHVYQFPFGVACRIQNDDAGGQPGDENTTVNDDALINYAVNELGGTVKNVEEE